MKLLENNQEVKTMQMLLNGQWVSRSETMTIHDPENGTRVAEVPKATLEDVETALEAALVGKQQGRDLATHQRINILRKAAESVDARQEEFARIIALEGIKTIREARKEVFRCAETLRISAEEARRLVGETIPFDQRPGSENRIGYVTREPVGIIACITPFNDPLNLVAHKLGPAIAAGNAVILKPHEQTPLSALALAQTLLQAGLPLQMLQVLTGTAEIGAKLVRDPRVRMVSFTGGRSTGKAILKTTGLKKVAMELGSNCPNIVMDDADLERAIPDLISGMFWAAGQNCLHVQRVLIHHKVYEAVKVRLVEATQKYNIGSKQSEETDMGCLVSEAAATRVETTVNAAIQAGAKLLTGGKREGSFYAPTILENVPRDIALYQEEIYGPVTILESFETLEQAVELANSVDYGLQATIFTQSLSHTHYAIRHLEAGAVIVNDSTDYRVDSMPFGGLKGSGLGREGVRWTMLEMSEPKVACIVL